jgi:hypothetical protein
MQIKGIISSISNANARHIILSAIEKAIVELEQQLAAERKRVTQADRQLEAVLRLCEDCEHGIDEWDVRQLRSSLRLVLDGGQLKEVKRSSEGWTPEGLEYIASSPSREHGGFHPNAIKAAQDALLEIRRLNAALAAEREKVRLANIDACNNEAEANDLRSAARKLLDYIERNWPGKRSERLPIQELRAALATKL